ncbi:MAG: hypothetical protein HY912_20370 [Desulfomonile tiedjei]|uniref:Uncharacterized protein n=1 Tax=Desulfomonile tiedjei TaxID=2358 RepID=A0A9D6V5F6_9BACT|nr:hypothetical protein [Desulfomonile tiedjei]
MRLLLSGSVFRYAVSVLVFVVFCCTSGVSRGDTPFNVCRDTFAISNAPGYCFAIAAFSRWYFLNHQGEPSLRQVVDKKTQQQIAKDLQAFYSKNLVGIQADYCNRYHGKQNESFKRLVAGLAVGEPRIVLLMNKGPRSVVLHAVLAYEWLPEPNKLKIYDPNYLNQERLLDLKKGAYSSLDITYNAICFPEVLNDHQELVKKMQVLYAQHVESKLARQDVSWRKAAATPADGPLKREGYTRGPTK